MNKILLGIRTIMMSCLAVNIARSKKESVDVYGKFTVFSNIFRLITSDGMI